MTVKSVKPSTLIREEKEKFQKRLKEKKAEGCVTVDNKAEVLLTMDTPAVSSNTTMSASAYRQVGYLL